LKISNMALVCGAFMPSAQGWSSQRSVCCNAVSVLSGVMALRNLGIARELML
jgi:hypothetical protein